MSFSRSIVFLSIPSSFHARYLGRLFGVYQEGLQMFKWDVLVQIKGIDSG
jgi:hypothetical protein